MANKKKTIDRAADMVVATGISDSGPLGTESVTISATAYTEDVSVETAKDYVPSELWYCVEDATGIGTLALNLPSGCLIMAILDQNKPVVQYVPGIHYDEANKRFSV